MKPDELARLIAAILERAQELDRLHGWQIQRRLGAPATVDQLALVEHVAGFELPADYRTFLELHNGWEGFSGENALLSAEQMTSGAMRASIDETKAIQRETNDRAANGLVINASISGSDIAFIVPSTGAVVRWGPGTGEYKRYASFDGYLNSHLEGLLRRIANR